MSGHGDPHDEAHGDDEQHDDDHHLPPPPEEPATPLWLTLLGVGLFLTAGILFIALRTESKTRAELTAPSQAEPAGSVAAPEPAAPSQAVRVNAPRPAAP